MSRNPITQAEIVKAKLHAYHDKAEIKAWESILQKDVDLEEVDIILDRINILIIRIKFWESELEEILTNNQNVKSDRVIDKQA